MSHTNSAKYAFFYILSLIALVFTALAVGMVVFQVINGAVPDALNTYSSRLSQEVLRFAISSLIIAAPIYYITSKQIYGGLSKGDISSEAGVRRWLTYLILLAAVVVMLGWLIGLLNGFLNGELTTKFILKTITALVISGFVFSFYLYDMRREKTTGKDKNIMTFFAISLVLVIAALVLGFFNLDSPSQTRAQKIDRTIEGNFSQIDVAIHNYYTDNEELPESLDQLMAEYEYLREENMKNPVNDQRYEYSIIDEDEYELCTEWQTSNRDSEEYSYAYEFEPRVHDAGYDCIRQKVTSNPKDAVVPRPL